MATTFEEILRKKREEAGITAPLSANDTPAEPTTVETPPVAETAPVEEELIIPEGFVEVSPETATADSEEELIIPEGFVEETTPVAETQQTFDSTTVVTPEMISGLDYDTLYDLSLQDSPLAPEQRLVIANALRGSSDLWQLFSGYESDLGADAVEVDAPKTRADILRNSQKRVSTATAANTAILEAVKGVRAQYLKDNPDKQQGVVGQAVQSIVQGTAAPRPDGATGMPVPSTARAMTDTAADSAMFGFSDEILRLAPGDSANLLKADASREALQDRDPTLALLSEIGGAVMSPSIGLKALGALGTGLKNSDKWYKTVAKLATAGAVDASLQAIGRDGDILTEGGIGGLTGGTLGAVLPAGGALGKAFGKWLTGSRSEVEMANRLLNDVSKLTGIDVPRLRKSVANNENFAKTLTDNGVSIDDAGKIVRQLTERAPTNKASKETADIANARLSDIANKPAKEVADYLESIDPKDIGAEIGDLFKSLGGSEIADITKRLMQTDAKTLYSTALRQAISDRARASASILEGSGNTIIKPENILIDKATGGIFVPMEGAQKLTKEQLSNTPNKFGYDERDLFEITDSDNLRGDVFQSAESIISREVDFREGQTPDQAFSEIIKSVKDETDSIFEGSVEGLGQANREYSRRKASKTAMDLTTALVKSKNVTPADVDGYVQEIKKLSTLNDPDRQKAVVNGVKNFFGSNPKTTNMVSESGVMNPSLKDALNKAGISKADLDMYEKMAADKVFYEAFAKSTGVVKPENGMVEEGLRRLSYQLFFHPPLVAVKNMALSMLGSKVVAGATESMVGKGYQTLVKQLASLDNKDFEKIKKLVQKGDPIFQATLKTATGKKILGRTVTAAARVIGSD